MGYVCANACAFSPHLQGVLHKQRVWPWVGSREALCVRLQASGLLGDHCLLLLLVLHSVPQGLGTEPDRLIAGVCMHFRAAGLFLCANWLLLSTPA